MLLVMRMDVPKDKLNANNSIHQVFSFAKEKTKMVCLDAAIKL